MIKIPFFTEVFTLYFDIESNTISKNVVYDYINKASDNYQKKIRRDIEIKNKEIS